MEDSWNHVTQLFNENALTVEPFEFFGMFRDFCRAYTKVREENHKRLAMEERDRPGEEVRLAASKPRAEDGLFVANDAIELPMHPILGTRRKGY